MMPSDLPDEMLDAVHAGADPLFFKDRPRYYTLVAEALAGWSTATNSAVKSLVRDAQASGDRAARAADRHRLAHDPGCVKSFRTAKTHRRHSRVGGDVSRGIALASHRPRQTSRDL